MEMRLIMGVRNSDCDLIVNPIVDVGNNGETIFAPAAREARKLGSPRDFCSPDETLQCFVR